MVCSVWATGNVFRFSSHKVESIRTLLPACWTAYNRTKTQHMHHTYARDMTVWAVLCVESRCKKYRQVQCTDLSLFYNSKHSRCLIWNNIFASICFKAVFFGVLSPSFVISTSNFHLASQIIFCLRTQRCKNTGASIPSIENGNCSNNNTECGSPPPPKKNSQRHQKAPKCAHLHVIFF